MGSSISVQCPRRLRQEEQPTSEEIRWRPENLPRIQVDLNVNVQPMEEQVLEIMDCRERSIQTRKWYDRYRYRMKDGFDECHVQKEHLHLVSRNKRPRHVKTQSMLTCFNQAEAAPYCPTDMRVVHQQKQGAWRLTREEEYRITESRKRERDNAVSPRAKSATIELRTVYFRQAKLSKVERSVQLTSG